MGCASSRHVGVALPSIYSPPPTSISLFDVSKIEEPWLMTISAAGDIDDDEKQQRKKLQPSVPVPVPVPAPLLEKLDSYELAPRSWSEVSKALEELRPSLQNQTPSSSLIITPTGTPPPPSGPKRPTRKANSFHTVAELDTKLIASSPHNSVNAKSTTPSSSPPRITKSLVPRPPPPELSTGFKPVRENTFIIRDRQERESKKKADVGAKWWRRDPLEGYPERRPPGNGDGVVLYTTTLRGVRRTFEDCEEVRRVVEAHAEDAGVEVEERDVSLHAEYLRELRELVGDQEGAAAPRLFVRGRYVGGAKDVAELGETRKLREMLRSVAARGEKGKGGRKECEGCGGARFVPCMVCNGSCKVVGEDGEVVVRCGNCNENGLDLCPICH